MTNLFNRATIFTDLHLGQKNNDKEHNLDCMAYIDWFIGITKQRQADCIIFLGDFHHNRNSLHISTLNYSLNAFEKLNQVGVPVYFIPGNHDEVFKTNRNLTSISIGRNLKNIKLYHEITTIDKVTFCPWLVGEEWKSIPDLAKQSSYIFGHFELPFFMMNAMIEMQDNGELQYNHFNDVEHWAVTGHFHKRQSKGKVLYMGNAFPHNFSDVWDDERGMAVLDWGQQPEFLQWPDAPKYRSFQLSELVENPESLLTDKMNVKITNDIEISSTQCQLLKELFQTHSSLRRIEITDILKPTEQYNFDEEQSYKTINQIVLEGLNNIDSKAIDKRLLIQIYEGL